MDKTSTNHIFRYLSSKNNTPIVDQENYGRFLIRAVISQTQQNPIKNIIASPE